MSGGSEASLAGYLKVRYGKLLIDYLANFNFDFSIAEATDNYDKLNSLE